MRVVVILSCAALLSACGHTEASTPPSQTPAADQGEQPALTRASHMQTSFRHATDVRDAIIAGDLEAAKAAATALNAQDHYAVLPADWKGLIERVRQHAEDVALSPDLPAAAQALASMATACGNCHHHVEGGPSAPQQPALGHPEPGPPDLATRMERHRVATGQLWLGLVVPSDELWQQGTVTLTRAELAAPTHEGIALEGWLQTEIGAVRTDAQDARAAPTHELRAGSYGNLLARCADCHAYVRR